MGHKVLLEGLDRTLRDLMENVEPFGGKVIVLAGDFRQLPTVLPRATRAQIVSASIKKSYLWPKFRILRLIENMRIINNGNDPKLMEFDEWLEKLGDGKLPTTEDHNSSIALPPNFVVKLTKSKRKMSQRCH